MDWENIPSVYDDYVGFVYKITHIDSGMYYIGKKTYWTIERRKYTRTITKQEKERLLNYMKNYDLYKRSGKTPDPILAKKYLQKYKEYKSELYNKYKGNKKTVRVKTEKDWRNYWGSSEKFKVYIEQEGQSKFKREILHNCSSLFDLSYTELLEQIKHNVLFDDKSFNEIINVRLPRMKDSLLLYSKNK